MITIIGESSGLASVAVDCRKILLPQRRCSCAACCMLCRHVACPRWDGRGKRIGQGPLQPLRLGRLAILPGTICHTTSETISDRGGASDVVLRTLVTVTGQCFNLLKPKFDVVSRVIGEELGEGES
jgi:hypothetical protein